ncbi:hypothetical protein [Myxococcus stipitatus]|uniref:hypothetical protein n=1 Tax=Myxococcus stipitatus TaxID=83455 RepID=UPI0030CD55B3
MKNLTGVLVFSTTLMLVLGCHKNTGENPGPSDSGQVPSSTAPSSTSKTSTDSGAASPDASTVKDAAGEPARTDAALEACVDNWLKKHKLDAYGNAEGTMYAGGTPLFDERTGESKDRMAFVFANHPEARKVCMQPSKTP